MASSATSMSAERGTQSPTGKPGRAPRARK
jgi:hypothetical protein